MPSKNPKPPAVPPHEREVIPAKIETWTRIFLRTLRLTGSVRSALKGAGKSQSYVYACKARSPKFSDQWDKALEGYRLAMVDRAEKELNRRAVKGWREPVYQAGRLVGYKRKFSDPALIELLRANNPAKFGRKSEINGTIAVALVSPAVQSRLSDPEYRRLRCQEDNTLTASVRVIELPSPDDNGGDPAE